MDMTRTLEEQLQNDFDQFPYRVWVDITLYLFKAPDSDALVRKMHITIPLPLSEEYFDSFKAVKANHDFASYEKSLAAMAAEIIEFWDTDLLTRLGWQPDLVESLRKKHLMFPYCSVYAEVNKVEKVRLAA